MVAAFGATTRSFASAGTKSRDSSTGSVLTWPVELTVVACCTRGNDTSIRSVVSGRLNATRPPNPTPACRVPAGLEISTVCGTDPPAACTISVRIRRLPCQLRWMTGFALSAISGWLPLNRLAGPGQEPAVATLTCRIPRPGGGSLSSSASRPAPGTASAAALSRRAVGWGTVNVRAIGAVPAGSAKVTGDGTCWWKEKLTDAARWPAGSSAGCSSLLTRTPGMSTSDIPAPGPPGVTRLAPAIVTRSQLVRPGATCSGWVLPVAATLVVVLPAAVETRSRLAISRDWLSSSRRIPTLAGRSTG